MEFLDVRDVAELLKCSTRTVHSLRSNEGLPFVKLGRLVRFPKQAVEEWLAGRLKTTGGAALDSMK